MIRRPPSSTLFPAEPLFRSPTKSSNLSETAEVPACNVPSRSPLPALAIAPETKLGTASSGLGTLYYFRDIGRMVLAAEGRKANDSHADCYQYFCEIGRASCR